MRATSFRTGSSFLFLIPTMIFCGLHNASIATIYIANRLPISVLIHLLIYLPMISVSSSARLVQRHRF